MKLTPNLDFCPGCSFSLLRHHFVSRPPILNPGIDAFWAMLVLLELIGLKSRLLTNEKLFLYIVGNIPYDATEEQLIQICEEVGPVVSFW
ncbi:UNVERIFIED_CONTAM: Cleavage stimulating factor 64 [Sesamum calycinum]|uniref:Cleavage stimulating factor 64 n=1 Tax=Sesamum calycinum TaxID=2727403 RepID=A0AAW2MA45_9LAMI